MSVEERTPLNKLFCKTLINIYKEKCNHEIALSTLLKNALDSSKENQTFEKEDNKLKFRKYIFEINKIPFLFLKKNDNSKKVFTHYNIILFKSSIKNFFKNVSDISKFISIVNKIVDSIEKLPSFLNYKKGYNCRTHFGQLISVEENDDVILIIYYIEYTVKYGIFGKALLKYDLNYYEYKLLGSILSADSEQLSYFQKSKALKWINNINIK